MLVKGLIMGKAVESRIYRRTLDEDSTFQLETFAPSFQHHRPYRSLQYLLKYLDQHCIQCEAVKTARYRDDSEMEQKREQLSQRHLGGHRR